MNLKRFNILFPHKKLERRNSNSHINTKLIEDRKKDFQQSIAKLKKKGLNAKKRKFRR